MPDGLKVSVLVPVYNERFLVAESLRRVLAVRHPSIRELEVIVVDDGSTDGTREILRALAREHPAIRLVEHPHNRGKGAALRTAIALATGDVSVPHDADLEYQPDDLARLVQPFLQEQADAVFGSRFLSAEYRRVLLFYHSAGNRLLTALVNLVTNLNLSDVETCYKMVRTELLKSIPLRYDDFRVEPELAIKLAKRGAAIFEAPIRYAGRTYAEGKKIGWRDGLRALGAIARGAVFDDLYLNDPYGAHILHSLSRARKFSRWMSDVVRPWVGRAVLEIGAGIGNLTLHLVPRERYVATDVNADYLSYLANFAVGKPYLEVAELPAESSEAFGALAGQFDTVVCLNVLEHLDQPVPVLRNFHRALAPGGRAIVLVPHGPSRFNALDRALGHRLRYTRDRLRDTVAAAGFEVEALLDFNRAGVVGWRLNGWLGRRHFSRFQLKVFDSLVWLFRRVDPLLPWPGLSLVAIGRKEDAATRVAG
jgi:glycosyltransferase involved in cell wall biosynthesis/phospholipid N-methyltransferase